MRYHIVPVTDFEQNCSLLWCESTQEAVIVDPGGDIDLILSNVRQFKLNPVKILLTHGHVDHVGGTVELKKCLSIPVEGPGIEDKPWLDAVKRQSEMFGLLSDAQPFVPDRWLSQGDRVNFGNEILDVIHCPGHTPGHVVFFNGKDRLALVGDVLFKGSIGRTDLPMGNHKALLHSIRHKLLPLGDDVQFIPGHGPMSNFGDEKRHNPFVRESVY